MPRNLIIVPSPDVRTNSNVQVILEITGLGPDGLPLAKEGDQYQISVVPANAMQFERVLQDVPHQIGDESLDYRTTIVFKVVPGSINAGECTITVMNVGDELSRVFQKITIKKPDLAVVRNTTPATGEEPMTVVSPLSTDDDIKKAQRQPETPPIKKNINLGIWIGAIALSIVAAIVIYVVWPKSQGESAKTARASGQMTTFQQLDGIKQLAKEISDTKADDSAKDTEAPAVSSNPNKNNNPNPELLPESVGNPTIIVHTPPKPAEPKVEVAKPAPKEEQTPAAPKPKKKYKAYGAE